MSCAPFLYDLVMCPMSDILRFASIRIFEMKKILAFVIVSLSFVLCSCSKVGSSGASTSGSDNVFANTSWSHIYSGSRMSCRLILDSDGSCNMTFYGDEFFRSVQSSVSGRYYVKGNRLEFNDNYIVTRIPPLNGERQYIKLVSASVSGSTLNIYGDIMIENGRWTGTSLSLSRDR